MTQKIEDGNNIWGLVLSNKPTVPIRPWNKKKKLAISKIINSHTSKMKTSIKQNRMVLITQEKLGQGHCSATVVMATNRNNFGISQFLIMFENQQESDA